MSSMDRPSSASPNSAPATRASLLADLRRLGVREGDSLFIHSSFKSLGPVAGGAETVIQALTDAVGSTGNILMPSFNLIKGDRAANWDWAQTPSTVGWLTEYFRTCPGVVRSDHYSHSVAAFGPQAEWLTNGHRSKEGMRSPWDREPWGRTYGTNSPMLRALALPRYFIFMLGVDYASSTYQHVVEVTDWNRRLETDPAADFFIFKPRELLGAYWETLGRFVRGPVAAADCRLFSGSDYVRSLVAEVQRNPAPYCPWHPDHLLNKS